ncbi:MAG: hypothetical protein FJX59_17535 [Alphaproteobacteria bacterium]|nr:hypothetical protein [Alphaproteobacteria bacterium]
MDNGSPATDPPPVLDFDLAGFLDGVAPAVVVFCRNDRVVFANASATRLIGAARPAVKGGPIEGVFRSCLDRARQRGASDKYFVFEQFVAGRWYMVQ